jgi:hypothetical protein
MKELTIIDELKNLLLPLTEAEFTGLEESIAKDGCLSPLAVWNDILVDGYHRYEICRKHQIPFAVKSIVLENLDEAKIWIWQHQGNRRNLTDFQRGEIALKLKNAIAAKAKERQLSSLKQNNTVPKIFAERRKSVKNSQKWQEFPTRHLIRSNIFPNMQMR